MATTVKSGQLGMATPFGELKGMSDSELNAELADYVSMGVNWIRTDIHWSWVQSRANGAYNWSAFDKVFNAAAAKGIEIVAVFTAPPDWVDSTFSSSSSKTAFNNLVSNAARHFGDTVDYWQIMNEVNKEHITPGNYTAMLKSAFNTINAVDSGDTVISAGLSPVPSSGNGLYGAVDYLKGIYANGGKNYFDAVGYHPYSWPLAVNDPAPWNGWQIMESGIRSTMVANGDSAKQVWMTEMGSPSQGKSGLGQGYVADVLGDAVQSAKGYAWAGPLMWYSYKDRGGSGSNTENWFGLLSPNGTRKEAYYVFKDLALADGGLSGGGSTGGGGTTTTTIKSSISSGSQVLNGYKDGVKIDVSAIDANRGASGNQSFTFIGDDWLTKAGQLGVYHDRSGNKTDIQMDTNGDAKVDIHLMVAGIHNLDASDFIL